LDEQRQDKGKGKVDVNEVQNEMNKTWVKKGEMNVDNGSALESGADNSSGN